MSISTNVISEETYMYKVLQIRPKFAKCLATCYMEKLQYAIVDSLIFAVGGWGVELNWNHWKRNKKKTDPLLYTAQKMKFSIQDLSSKCDQILKKLWIWSHLLKTFLMKKFIFCAVIIRDGRVFSLFRGIIIYKSPWVVVRLGFYLGRFLYFRNMFINTHG